MTTNEPLNSDEPLKATLTVDYEPATAWGVRVAATGVAIDRVADATTPLYRTDSYLALDVFAWFQLGSHGLMHLGFANLSYARYIDWIDVRGRAANDPLVPYAAHPGRSVLITATWTF